MIRRFDSVRNFYLKENNMIAIKDMDMPKNCFYCSCSDDTGYCKITKKDILKDILWPPSRPEDCPLVEVVEPKKRDIG